MVEAAPDVVELVDEPLTEEDDELDVDAAPDESLDDELEESPDEPLFSPDEPFFAPDAPDEPESERESVL